MTPIPLDIAIKATAVLGTAALIQLCLRRRGSAAARHLVWTVAVGGLLVLPLASVTLPPWNVAIPLAHGSGPVIAPAPAAAVRGRGFESLTGAPLAAPTPSSAQQPSARQRTPFEWMVLAIALYGVGVMLFVARLVVEQRGLRRLVRTSWIVSDPAWQRMLEAIARQLHVRGSVRLVQSPDDIMPLTFGTREPVVVLPGAAAGWTDGRRRAVLMHELAHVARHDCFTQRLAAIACALYWPHPGIWWAARRLRIERELACDDRVLGTGTEAREYATHLLDIAYSLRTAPAPSTALGMARRRQLENRLLALMDSGRNREGLRRRGRIIAIAAWVVLLPLAALRAAIAPAAIVAADTAGRLAPSSPAESPASRQSTTISRPQGLSGTWEIRLAPDAGTVQLSLRTAHSSSGMTFPLARFDGLTASQISGAGGPVRFSSRRDAGTFTFEGICRGGLCGGTYTFAPDAAFASELARRGIGTPTDVEQYQLALNDVGVAFVDGLKGQGYAMPVVHDLVRASEHGVSLGYVQAMAALGYRLGTVDALIRLRDHGVDPEFVRGLSANGLTRLAPEELVRARDHGVDPRYVKGMRDLGYGSAVLEDLVKLRDHGVDPKFAGDLAALGYARLTLDALVRARDHGVDPAYVGGLQGLGYGNLPLEVVIRLRDHGVDPAYVKDMAVLGYTGLPSDTLIRLRDHGVDPAWVRTLQQRGVGNLSVDDLIRRRDRGEDDPNVAARAALSWLWRSIVAWTRA